SPPPPRSTLFPYTTLFRSTGQWLKATRHADLSPLFILYAADLHSRLDESSLKTIIEEKHDDHRKLRTGTPPRQRPHAARTGRARSEEHTSELQSQSNLVCR